MITELELKFLKSGDIIQLNTYNSVDAAPTSCTVVLNNPSEKEIILIDAVLEECGHIKCYSYNSKVFLKDSSVYKRTQKIVNKSTDEFTLEYPTTLNDIKRGHVVTIYDDRGDIIEVEVLMNQPGNQQIKLKHKNVKKWYKYTEFFLKDVSIIGSVGSLGITKYLKKPFKKSMEDM